MSYYEKKELEFIANPDMLSAGENAASAITDLLLGKEPYIEELVDIPDEHLNGQFNTRDGLAMTDGVIDETSDYTSPEWFRFTRGVDRTVTFRLDYLSAVSGFEVCFLKDEKTAVRPPRKLFILLSENGRDWELVSRDSRFVGVEERCNIVKSITLDTPRRALYVRFKFDVACHVWCGKLAAYGCNLISDGVKAVTPCEGAFVAKQRLCNKFPDVNDFLGIHNVLLSYNCLPPEKAANGAGLITEEQYLPYVAYLDKEKKITDTMFDSFLYLPYTAFNYSALAKSADGWHYYLDNCFANGRNLDALESTVKTVKIALGLPDYKVHVFFSILYTFTTSKQFGSLDGGAKCLDFTDINDRKAAIKWIVEEYIRRFNKKKTENTVLGGFYWFEESITYADEHELELISYARELVHSHGMKFFWIPWYQATGFSDWQEVGFDIACMQPNYAFRREIPEARLYDNAEMSKKMGLCVEMESYDIKDHFNVNKFKQYMDCGAETGYMNSVKMYYQGGVPGDFYEACHSDDPEVRSLYDDLYLYAKEKYVSRRNR